jgi:hypothetical protein
LLLLFSLLIPGVRLETAMVPSKQETSRMRAGSIAPTR